MDDTVFTELVTRQGERLYRPMPWREPEPDGSFSAYKILVSEMMLQQTQVSRVIPKFTAFLALFPSVYDLADAPLADVLRAWSGLGYNRRARYLHEAAKQLAGAREPWSLELLTTCKGIGQNTAKAVRVYAYNAPEVFIETNIRSVYIHYFFPAVDQVNDAAILQVVTRTLDTTRPRAFYWALMDLGASLKATHGNAARRSAHYARQSSFEGSLRQIRGGVLKLLADTPRTLNELQPHFDDRLTTVLDALESEGLIHKQADQYDLGAAQSTRAE